MTVVLRVIEPGLLTTVQDLGRPHAIAAGVPPGGAMDRFAHRAANLLVGNDENDATLECTLSGPRLVAERSCLIAVAGADFAPRINAEAAPMWASIFLGEGDQLSFGGRRLGARVYIAAAGGIQADRWLGSMSTNLMVSRGGFKGRNLKAGDLIAVAHEPRKPALSGRSLAAQHHPDYRHHALDAIAGPHLKMLDGTSRSQLFGSQFRVTHEADRMGYRLDGPALSTTGEELLSFGLAAGAVQVPRGGQPILLMADHQTAGGYPVVATVVSASMPVAAQLVPGDDVSFAQTTADRAQALRTSLAGRLDTLRTQA